MRYLFGVVLTVLLTGCASTSSAPPEGRAATAETVPAEVKPPQNAEGNEMLRAQKEQLDALRREYENCKDLHQYGRMVQLARARRIELDRIIRKVHQSHFTSDERERILTPLRQERDWQLEVIEAASAIP